MEIEVVGMRYRALSTAHSEKKRRKRSMKKGPCGRKKNRHPQKPRHVSLEQGSWCPEGILLTSWLR